MSVSVSVFPESGSVEVASFLSGVTADVGAGQLRGRDARLAGRYCQGNHRRFSETDRETVQSGIGRLTGPGGNMVNNTATATYNNNNTTATTPTK